jgi:hypothetical protein
MVDFRVLPLEPDIPSEGSNVFNAPVVETPTVDVFDMRRGQTFTFPTILNEDERDFFLERDVDKKPQEGVVGTYDLLDGAGDIAKGFKAFIHDIPNIPRRLKLEDLEVAKDEIGGVDSAARKTINPAEGLLELLWPGQNRINLNEAELNRAITKTRQDIGRNLIDLEIKGLKPGDHPLSQWFFDFGSGTGSVGSAIAVTMITRNPLYAGMFFGTLQKTHIYEEARAAGKTPKEAARISTTAGAIEGGLETLGNAIFLKLARKSKWLVPIITRALEEGAQELSQQTGEEILTMTTGVREVDLDSAVGRIAYAGALGVLIGVPVATVTQTMENMGQAEKLTPETIRMVNELLERTRPELQFRSAEIISNLQSDASYSEETRRAVSDIMAKFISGEEINIEEVLGRVPVDVQRSLAGLVIGEAREIDVKEVVKKGRVREVERQMGAMEKQISALEAERDARIEEGKPVVAVGKKIDKLVGQYRKFETEAADILFPPKRAGLLPEENETLDRLIGEELKKQDIAVKGRDVERIAAQANKESIRALRRGFREGLRVAKASIKEAQTAIADLIQKSPLAAKDKAKFLKTIKNIQTEEQFNKQLPRIQNRVMRLLMSERERTARDKIRTALKRAKPVKSGAKPVGKFTPDIQEVLDQARAAFFKTENGKITSKPLSADEAKAKLDAALAEEMAGPEAELTNKILAIAAHDESVSAEEMEEVFDELDSLAKFGRIAAKSRRVLRKFTTRDTTEKLSAAVTQGKDIDAIKTTGTIARLAMLKRNIVSDIGGLNNAWDEILDIVFNKKGVDAAAAIESLRVTRELQKAKGILRNWDRKLTRAAQKAFGLKSDRQVYNKLYEDNVRHNLGKFTNKNGQTVELEYSTAESRKMWMEIQDDTISETYSHERGNAYTPEMVDAIFARLTPEDKAYAEKQLEIYREIYDEVNPVYREMYGVNLPFNPFYSPIKRDKAANPLRAAEGFVEGSFLGDELYFRRIPSSLKSRVENVWPLQRQNDTGVMHRHFHDMSHFIAMAEKMRHVNAVMTNARLRKEIEQFHGKSMVKQIDSFLKDMNTGYLIKGQTTEAIFARAHRGFAKAVLAIKPTIGLKQLTSYFIMSENIPLTKFIADNLDFLKHPRESMKILWDNSEGLQHRGSSPDLEFARLNAAQDDIIKFKHKQTMDNLMMIFIRWGDRAPIYMGGWSVYKHALRQGKSQAEAVTAFEDAFNSTQQSTDIDKMSDAQRGGPLFKVLTMFSTSKLALLRAELRAIRQRPKYLGGRGKISTAEFAKRIFFLHILMPSLIQMIASGFRYDPDRQLVAMITGQLNSALILGEIVYTSLLWAMTDDKFHVGRDIPFYEVAQDVMMAIRDMATEDFLEEEWMEAAWDLIAEASKPFGIPAEQAGNIAVGGMRLVEGEDGGIKLMMGVSPYTVDKDE